MVIIMVMDQRDLDGVTSTHLLASGLAEAA